MSWLEIAALVVVGLIVFAVLVQIVADAVVRTMLRVRRGELELIAEFEVIGSGEEGDCHAGCRCRKPGTNKRGS